MYVSIFGQFCVLLSSSEATFPIFWTVSSVIFTVLTTCPPNKLYTTADNRTGRSIWVSGYWPFHMLFVGLIYNHCSETLKASAGKPARLLPRVKMPFVQFFTFKRVNHVVVNSWIWHFKILLPAALHWEGHVEMDFTHIDFVWYLHQTGFDLWCRVLAFSLTSLKGYSFLLLLNNLPII